MITFFIIFLIITVWIGYEMWRAPLLDDNYNVIRPAKRLRDLFKKKNK